MYAINFGVQQGKNFRTMVVSLCTLIILGIAACSSPPPESFMKKRFRTFFPGKGIEKNVDELNDVSVEEVINILNGDKSWEKDNDNTWILHLESNDKVRKEKNNISLEFQEIEKNFVGISRIVVNKQELPPPQVVSIQLNYLNAAAEAKPESEKRALAKAKEQRKNKEEQQKIKEEQEQKAAVLQKMLSLIEGQYKYDAGWRGSAHDRHLSAKLTPDKKNVIISLKDIDVNCELTNIQVTFTDGQDYHEGWLKIFGTIQLENKSISISFEKGSGGTLTITMGNNLFCNENDLYGDYEKVSGKIEQPKSADNANSRNTRQGVLAIIRPAAYENMISLNGKTIWKNDINFSVSFVKDFKMGNDEIFLIECSSGGVTCPSRYRFIILKDNNPPLLSKEFGNCSEEPKVEQIDQKVVITFPKTYDKENIVVLENNNIVENSKKIDFETLNLN